MLHTNTCDVMLFDDGSLAAQVVLEQLFKNQWSMWKLIWTRHNFKSALKLARRVEMYSWCLKYRSVCHLFQTQSNISPKLRKDAHEVILEFIRSRPTLKPVSRRRNSSKSGDEESGGSGQRKSRNATEILTARDAMLNMIRNRPNLRHIQTPNFNRGLQLGRVGWCHFLCALPRYCLLRAFNKLLGAFSNLFHL